MIHDFLPVCRADMEKRGWDQCDFVYVCGDAYVDHPSFGSAIISRVLESYGYKVGVIAQPDWKDKESIQVLGRPRLGFLVSAGNMDSMVTIIPSQKDAAIRIPTRRAVLWEGGRITRRWFTAT